MNDCEQRLANEPEGSSLSLFDEITNDVIAPLGGERMLEQPEAQASHVGSRPTSSPEAMRRSARIDACNSRRPAGVTE